ncbi:MAG: hypothetical protein HON70_26855, partial [Lentisphaerae bacterium]|nr:hypothetical protein [Lentisphaerota bacterium]
FTNRRWNITRICPAETNEERLKVTNALARQLPMRINVDYTGKHMWRPKEPPRLVSSRHGQCGAICLYTVARYFCRDYPDPTWEYAAMVAKRVFAPLHERAGVVGEFDTHFWYSTSMEQVLNYMLLSGDRVPLENGMLETLLNGHETLISGRPEHWSLNYAAIGYLHKAAYLRNDGAWIRYRERTGVDVDTFRVGQSFWPDRQLAAKEPDALVGKWLVHRVPKPLWEHRELKTPLESAFQFMSFRSRPDRTGDFLLLDGLYGKGRNPYHVFPIVELRLNGHTVLTEFRNQISVTVDGQVPEKMPVSAGLLHHSVLGDAVTAIAEVPDMTHCHWRRSLVQRIGRYALIVDELIMAADSDNVDVEIGWEGPYPEWNAERVLVRMNEDHESQKAPWYNIIPADPATGVVENYAITPGKRAPLARVGFIRAARKGEQLNFFSLIAPEKAAPLCMRSGDNTAALRLPTPGRVVLGSAGSTRAGLAILAADHLYGHDLETAGGEDTLIRAQTPVEVWWDFESGRLEIHTTRETRLALCLAAPKRVTLDGAPVHVSVTDGVTELTVSEGRHHLRGAKPDKSMLAGLASVLANDTRMASARRNSWQSPDAPEHLPAMPSLSPAFTVPIGGDVSDMVVAPDVDSPRIYAAIGNTVHALNADGQTEWSATTEGEIKVIHWWSEHQLLLLGCRDEKVIAFAADGERKWEFVSEMDAEFTRNAIATHWFKNAHPTHRGIHGLHTGVFIDGKSQAFVGSACTIEIIDENGQFLKRIVQKWG